MQYDDLLQHESLIQPADAIEMLKADHRRVHKLFQSYEATNEPAMQQRIAMALFVALELHTQLEETVFYPAFAEQAHEEGKQLVSEALQDHQQLRDLIATLQDVAEDEAFETRFHALRDHVEQHVEDEETTMFPQATQVLATHLEEITVLLQERKAQILAS